MYVRLHVFVCKKLSILIIEGYLFLACWWQFDRKLCKHFEMYAALRHSDSIAQMEVEQVRHSPRLKTHHGKYTVVVVVATCTYEVL